MIHMLELVNVHRTYQIGDSTVHALRGVSVTIEQGEFVAVMGASGSGKSSLLQILGLLDNPDNGEFLIFGNNVNTLSEDEKAGVRNNVAGFVLSGAHEVFERLEGGYEAILGNLFDGGRELSMGEWQKIAIARAFLRDASIMILDEPTSSLDVEAEYELVGQFNELTRGKAALIISHRLSTVRMAARIIVLADGIIAEEGTHETLINQNGTYARLYNMQSSLYQ